MRFGIEASESLVEILGTVREARNRIDTFSMEYSSYLGADSVAELKNIREVLADSMTKLNSIGDSVDKKYKELTDGSRKVPTYHMQLFRNELIGFRTSKHIYLRFPRNSGYEDWNGRLSKRFVTTYENGTSEWRYYPQNTHILIYKYKDDGSRTVKRIEGGKLAEILDYCSRLIQKEASQYDCINNDLSTSINTCISSDMEGDCDSISHLSI